MLAMELTPKLRQLAALSLARGAGLPARLTLLGAFCPTSPCHANIGKSPAELGACCHLVPASKSRLSSSVGSQDDGSSSPCWKTVSPRITNSPRLQTASPLAPSRRLGTSLGTPHMLEFRHLSSRCASAGRALHSKCQPSPAKRCTLLTARSACWHVCLFFYVHFRSSHAAIVRGSRRWRPRRQREEGVHQPAAVASAVSHAARNASSSGRRVSGVRR